jgi:hypothetical protein
MYQITVVVSKWTPTADDADEIGQIPGLFPTHSLVHWKSIKQNLKVLLLSPRCAVNNKKHKTG